MPNAEMEQILNKIYGNNEEKKCIVKNILKQLETQYTEEFSKLSIEEKLALVLQTAGYEQNIQEIFSKGINYDKLLKIRKLVGEMLV